jgi:ArsR family transcriptional regulator, arsenate/arsenite/antimonite-responsive transcriptional repressor
MDLVQRADAEEWAAWFRALADPTRLQVLNAIATYGPELTIGQLVARVDIGQSTVSHHVRVLAEAGFILHERHARTSRVSVNQDCLSALPDAARAVLGSPSRLDPSRRSSTARPTLVVSRWSDVPPSSRTRSKSHPSLSTVGRAVLTRGGLRE